jgi:hypothetical protein
VSIAPSLYRTSSIWTCTYNGILYGIYSSHCQPRTIFIGYIQYLDIYLQWYTLWYIQWSLSAAHHLYRLHLVFGNVPTMVYSMLYSHCQPRTIFIGYIWYLDMYLQWYTYGIYSSHCQPGTIFIGYIWYLDMYLQWYTLWYIQ